MSTLTRRALLSGLVLSAAGCSKIVDTLTEPELPDSLHPPSGTARNPTAHLLNRATYGPRPGQIERVAKQGHGEWLEQQLDYKGVKDDTVNWRMRRYDTLKMKPRDLLSFSGGPNRDYVRDELGVAAVLRAVYSERQLFEVMVGFWTNHFNLYHYKNGVNLLKTHDDRTVIRQHALGNFGDLLRASAHSPAMLIYLDNVLNKKGRPNENYAREIMELHTLGVEGGYTEHDVKEVARCFTGWTVDQRGEFSFEPDWHDDGAKTVLGTQLPANHGKSDGERVLELLITHPNTVRFVCTKLVRYFVSDDPPSSVVSACVETWTQTDGDIRPVLRTLFMHPDFYAAPPKLKRPFELVISLIRATGASYNGNPDLLDVLERLGQRPFGWPTPDGYPDSAEAWSGNMLGRWNVALDLLRNRAPGVRVEVDELARAGNAYRDGADWLQFFGRLFLKRDLSAVDSQSLREFAFRDAGPIDYDTMQNNQLVQTLGLLAASPAFQWR